MNEDCCVVEGCTCDGCEKLERLTKIKTILQKMSRMQISTSEGVHQILVVVELIEEE
jgi:hypothetical protein